MLRRLGWLALLLLLLAGLAWALRPRETQTVRGGRFAGAGAMPVAAAPAQKGDMPVTLNALGTVTPLATVTVKTQISGQLVQIGFQEGQMVKTGDFLAQVDPRPYQAALEQMEGQLLRDQALLNNAQLDAARYRRLVQQDSVAKQTLDTTEALVHQYEGTVKSDQGQVDTAKLNLVYCHVVAPISGRVGLRQVDQGNYVQTSDTNGLVVITQLQPITVLFTLPEDSLPEVMKRLHAGVPLQVVAYDRSQTTKLATGVLMTVDNQIDTTTGTVKLKAQFPNEDESLFPNQFVNVDLVLNVLHDATIIPVSAVQRGAPGTFVYVVKPDETVTVRPISTGPTDGDRVVVDKGLTVGETVVVDGADKLRDGAKVTMPKTAGVAGAPAAPNAGSNRPQGARRRASTETPGTQAPETQAPETQAPETQAPGAQPPGTTPSGTAAAP
jgi:multidrug efflux system membrane fusion protein